MRPVLLGTKEGETFLQFNFHHVHANLLTGQRFAVSLLSP